MEEIVSNSEIKEKANILKKTKEWKI
jgi:hypothetical protein